MKTKQSWQCSRHKETLISAKPAKIAPQIAKDYQIQKNPSLPIKAVRGCLYLSKSRRSETTVHTVEPHMQVLYMSESRMPETIMYASKLTNTTENRRLGWHPSRILP